MPMAGNSPADPGDDVSLVDTLQGLLHELPGLISDRVELFALELARASQALARIVAWLVAIAIVGVTAWLTFWAGLAVWLIVDLHLHWAVALLPVLVINLVAVVVGFGQVRQLASRLSLPATRRHLTMSRSAPAPAPAGADAVPPLGNLHVGAQPVTPPAG
jgi:uncharacterized membrane protein YqjE